MGTVQMCQQLLNRISLFLRSFPKRKRVVFVLIRHLQACFILVNLNWLLRPLTPSLSNTRHKNGYFRKLFVAVASGFGW